MSNILEKCNRINEEKNTKLLPENLKAGITCFGVTGNLEEGIDTSNATAVADDIISGKTAYINGELVTGTITDARNISMICSASASNLTKYDTKITLAVPPMYPLPKVISANTYMAVDISNDILASAIGLTADKLVEGVTVLGITGTGGSQ